MSSPEASTGCKIEVHQFVKDERQDRSGSLRAGAERYLLGGLAQIGNVHEQKVLGARAGDSRDIRGNGLRGPLGVGERHRRREARIGKHVEQVVGADRDGLEGAR